jgi:hypothetical protein
LLAVWTIERTAGVGGLMVAVTATAVTIAWSMHPPFVVRTKRAERLSASEAPPDRRRRRAWAATWGLMLAFALWNLASASWYAFRYNTDDPLNQRVATWARNHG